MCVPEMESLLTERGIEGSRLAPPLPPPRSANVKAALWLPPPPTINELDSCIAPKA